jgi:hypothetical protein
MRSGGVATCAQRGARRAAPRGLATHPARRTRAR